MGGKRSKNPCIQAVVGSCHRGNSSPLSKAQPLGPASNSSILGLKQSALSTGYSMELVIYTEFSSESYQTRSLLSAYPFLTRLPLSPLLEAEVYFLPRLDSPSPVGCSEFQIPYSRRPFLATKLLVKPKPKFLPCLLSAPNPHGFIDDNTCSIPNII